jgi:hypothetical protein
MRVAYWGALAIAVAAVSVASDSQILTHSDAPVPRQIFAGPIGLHDHGLKNAVGGNGYSGGISNLRTIPDFGDIV